MSEARRRAHSKLSVLMSWSGVQLYANNKTSESDSCAYQSAVFNSMACVQSVSDTPARREGSR